MKEEEALKEVLKVVAAFQKKGKTQGSIRRLLVDLCEPAMKARGFVISRQEVLNCHVVFGTAEELAVHEKAIKEAAKVAAKAAKERAKREAEETPPANPTATPGPAASPEPTSPSTGGSEPPPATGGSGL